MKHIDMKDNYFFLFLKCSLSLSLKEKKVFIEKKQIPSLKKKTVLIKIFILTFFVGSEIFGVCHDGGVCGLPETQSKDKKSL